MSLSVDWATKIITIPKDYLTYVSGNTYKLDVDQFRLDLKNLEDNVDGIVFPDTHRHNAEVSVGGITLSRVVEIINGYTVTFENGQYIVNLTGANNNISDVANLNQVSIRSANSAGMITIVSGSGVTEQDKLDIADKVWDEPREGHDTEGTKGETLTHIISILTGKWVIDKDNSLLHMYSGDLTPLRTFELLDENGALVDFTNPNAVIYERRPV